TDSKNSGKSASTIPRSTNASRNAPGSSRASMLGSFAAGHEPTYVMWTLRWAYAARTYRAAATGGAASTIMCGTSSAPARVRRSITCGQAERMAVSGSCAARYLRQPSATNSSPQVAGNAISYPRAWHACANLTDVAGNAASTASAPRMTTDTVPASEVGRRDMGEIFDAN